MKSKILTGSIIATYALLNTPAFAEETTLDPIVVTADFREKTLSETSSSVTVIGEEEIYDKASAPFEEVIGKSANVNFTTAGSRAHHIQIRGIGERAQFQYPLNPSVGLNIDGMDFSNSTLGVTLFDVGQIEILKGPQGTTFGANGMAGVINIQSNEPTKETQGRVETTIGNYNTKGFGAAVGGTLIEDTLIGRISVYKNSSDGYMENAALNRDDTQNIDELSTKTHLRWFAADNHTVDFNFMHVDVDNGFDAYTFDNSFTSYSDEPGDDVLKSNAFGLKSTYQVNSKMKLISKLDWSDTDNTYSYDNDWWDEGRLLDGDLQYVGSDSYARNIKNIAIDVRLVSDEDGRIFNDTTDWTIGLYHQNKKQGLDRKITYVDYDYDTGEIAYSSLTNLISDYETESTAIYGQLDTEISDKLTLITGLRIEKWKSNYTDSEIYTDDLNTSASYSSLNNANINTNETLLGTKLGLNYEYDQDTLIYGFISKGYKPGGVNISYSILTNVDSSYKTESLWDFEVGVNAKHLDGKLISRTNIFYEMRRDQHTTLTEIIDGVYFYDYITNAAKGHNVGLESELHYYPNDNLHLYSNIGLLKAKYDEYSDSNGYDLQGRDQAQSPHYQFNVGFDYMFASNFKLSSNIEGKGDQYFDEYTNEKIKSYHLFNAALEYGKENWSATLWVRNLADKEYAVKAYDFDNTSSDWFGGDAEIFTQKGAPRTFGFTVAYDF